MFQLAIPALLMKWLREQVAFFMKDTDPQQRNELLGGLKNVFVNETEGTCGFHIVNMGWEKYVPVVGSNACNLQK